jgi:hypothetical protein
MAVERFQMRTLDDPFFFKSVPQEEEDRDSRQRIAWIIAAEKLRSSVTSG